MLARLNDQELDELLVIFRDVINYEADDVCTPIDPLTYVAPDGDTCLHIAAHRGNRRAVELLLKAGANPNRPGDMGYTALHYASDPNVITLLLDHGASGNVLDEFGRPALK